MPRCGARQWKRWATTRSASPASISATGGAVLLVGHLLEPLHHLAVERLLDGDMLHRILGRRAVPMLLAGGEPDNVAGPDLLDRATVALHEPAAEEHDQRL